MNKMYEEGGLATDGMDVDPMSGNDIPIGSNATDVRDDVDAKLSSGEYIVPADVVKFIGVAQLEELVQEAKEGLEDMANNGRIGGAPADNDNLDDDLDDDDDLDLDNIDLDLYDDNGYALGGMVEGMDIDNIVNRVKAAATKDPSMVNMLKAKGIFLQEPQPQGQLQQDAMAQGTVPVGAAPPNMQGQNTPSAYAEGGAVYSPPGSFNPFDYAPGFSIDSYETGKAPTGLGGKDPKTPIADVCGPGTVWDAEQNMCVPTKVTPKVTSNSNTSNDDVNNYGLTGTTDTTSWMDKFDYSKPENLLESTMTTLGGGKDDGDKKVSVLGGLGSMVLKNLSGGLLGGVIGKTISMTNVAKAAANEIILRDSGREDLADKLKDQIAKYTKEKGLENVPTDFIDGDRFAKTIEETQSKDISQWSTDPTKTTPKPTRTPVKQISAAEATKAYVDSGQRSRSDRGGGTMDETIARAQQTRIDQNKEKQAGSVAIDEAKFGVGASEPGGHTGSTVDEDTGKKEETYSSRVSRGGGFATGGLVSKPKAKAKPKTKKTTNKKSLGLK